MRPVSPLTDNLLNHALFGVDFDLEIEIVRLPMFVVSV